MSGAHIAAHAAAQRRRQQQEEEERMTSYNPSDLNEWEFKIVRSTTNQFGKPDVFRQMVEEESLSGWQLLEKLDDGRVRFKRPVSARKRDTMLPPGIDPYRTRYGISEGALGLLIALFIMGVVFGIVGIVALVESGALNF